MEYLYFDNDPDGSKYGLLPKIALASKGSIAANSAVSFCERINSAANVVMTKGNTLLNTEEVNMLTVLRVNRDFMKHMRLNHPEISEQQFRQTLIGDAENEADSDSE